VRQAQVARLKTLTAVERLRTGVVDVLDRQRVATRGGVVVRKDRVVVETTRVDTEHQHLGAAAVGRVRSVAGVVRDGSAQEDDAEPAQDGEIRCARASAAQVAQG